MRWDRTKGRPEPIRALNRIVERENGEPLVDLRVVTPELRLLRPQTIPFCRRTVAEMAARASAQLPPGVYLGVTDAWRPIERQQRIYDWMMMCAREAFPERDYRALRRTVNRWVAPTDQKAPPGHCTGAAIDVNLVDETGEPLDVSSPFTRMTAGPTYTLGLSKEAAENRALLVETMLAVGFSNCRDEWWHYSYGDAGWAVRTGHSECVYGIAHLDRELYIEHEQISAEALAGRPNPFLEPPVQPGPVHAAPSDEDPR